MYNGSMTEIKPTHCWVKRSLYLNGKDAVVSNTVIEFEDPLDDESMANAFVEILTEYGNELDLGDFTPVRMDTGRYLIKSHTGFSLVEIDPAWTEEQIEQMEAAVAPQLDMKTWGSIFSVEAE